MYIFLLQKSKTHFSYSLAAEPDTKLLVQCTRVMWLQPSKYNRYLKLLSIEVSEHLTRNFELVHAYGRLRDSISYFSSFSSHTQPFHSNNMPQRTTNYGGFCFAYWCFCFVVVDPRFSIITVFANFAHVFSFAIPSFFW